MGTLFITGFPGFVSVGLLPELLRQRPDTTSIICLVQHKYINYAKKIALRVEKEFPAIAGKIKLEEGDITLNDLGLEKTDTNRGKITEVFHLAAAHDPTVPWEFARRVNVEGTRHVLRFAENCGKLKRFHHMSTSYVSGRHQGLFREQDLDVGQKFSNHDDESKFEAELEVSRAGHNGLPVTVYRPSMIVGDSSTGATQKFDGIYRVIRWLMRMPPVFFFPRSVGMNTSHFNIVPRDFVAKAIAYLSSRDESLGKTYQLVDPRPLKTWLLIRLLASEAHRKLIPVPVPMPFLKQMIRSIKAVRNGVRVPPQMFDYLTNQTIYSAENMLQDLRDSGIAVPAVPSYAEKMVEFVLQHPEVSGRPLV